MGSQTRPSLQKHLLIPLEDEASDPQVDVAASQSTWDPQTVSLGDIHWISKPGRGQRFTGKPESRLTKLEYALQPESLTRIM